MRIIFVLFLFCFTFTSFACDRPINNKKVVLYVGFHGGNEEIKGAIEGACKRGERLVAIPDISYMKDLEKFKEQTGYNKSKTTIMKAYNAAQKCYAQQGNCVKEVQDYESKLAAFTKAQGDLNSWENEHKEKGTSLEIITKKLEDFKANGTHLSSLILSGHDGGGHFYGDTDGITKEQILSLASKYPDEMNNMSSLLLMGCWSAVPKEVDEWKTAFPRLKIVGGFVGSAPAVERPAGGHFIADLLSSESKIGNNKDQNAVKNLLGSVRDLKTVTAGVYVDTTKSGCNNVTENKNQYYFVSPALNETEIGEDLVGLHPYKSTASSEAELQCRVYSAQFDWKTIDSYFMGDKEPDNTPELKSLYSSLRNHEHCFTNHFVQTFHSPDQVLFLRFFPGVKQNFAKYFDKEMKDSMEEINNLLKTATNPDTKRAVEEYLKNPLTSESIAKMNRREILNAISKLDQIQWYAYSVRMPLSRKLSALANIHLYRLECMDPTWHEYIEGATLAPPTCNDSGGWGFHL